MATTKVSTKLLETVGVAEGGTGATSASAARTSLGLVIGTNVLAPNGSGSSLTGIATGATDAEAANIMLNTFRISVNGGLSVLNMVDGVADAFEDATGIDAGASTTEVRYSGNFYRGEPTGYGSDVVPVMSSNTAPSGVVSSDASSAVDAWKAFDGTTASFNTGENVFPFWMKYDFGSGNGKIIKRYTLTSGASEYNRTPGTFTFEGSNNDSSWTTLDTQTGITYSASQTRTFSFSNTTVYRYYKINVTGNEVTLWPVIPEMEMIEGAAPYTNMILVPNATTALAVPTDAFIVLWQEDVDSVTLNTDLKAYASRDGSTYTQMTLTKEATIAPVITTTSSAIGEFDGATADMTFSGDDIDPTAHPRAIKSNDTFTGDVEVSFTLDADTSSADAYVVGFYDITEDSTFSSTNASGGMNSMTNSWRVELRGNASAHSAYYYGSSDEGDLTNFVSSGEKVTIKRVGTTFTVLVDGALNRTFSDTGSQTLRLVIATGDSASDYINVSWTYPLPSTNILTGSVSIS